MKLKTILLGTALASVTLFASSNLVHAQVCPRIVEVPPAKQTRIIRNDSYGYRFSIPQNYRSMAFRSNTVLIFDPGTFETAQCYIRTKAPTELPSGISIYVTPVNPGNRSVAALVRQNDPTIEKIENTKVANQTAVSYTSNNQGYQRSVSFFTPDRRYMITASAPFNLEQGRPTTIFNKEVFDTVLSSFTFGRS
jgi:hypothetical protein